MVRRAIGAIDTASTVLGLLLRASNIHLERASLAYTPRSTHLKGTVASLADSPSLAPDTSVPNVPSPASPLKRTSYNDSNAILGLEGAILRPNTGSSRSEVLPETPPHPLADFAIHALPKSTIEVDSRDQGDTPGPNLEPEKPEEVRSSAVADAVSASATASDTIHDSSDQHEPQQAYQVSTASQKDIVRSRPDQRSFRCLSPPTMYICYAHRRCLHRELQDCSSTAVSLDDGHFANANGSCLVD